MSENLVAPVRIGQWITWGTDLQVVPEGTTNSWRVVYTIRHGNLFVVFAQLRASRALRERQIVVTASGSVVPPARSPKPLPPLRVVTA